MWQGGPPSSGCYVDDDVAHDASYAFFARLKRRYNIPTGAVEHLTFGFNKYIRHKILTSNKFSPLYHVLDFFG